MNKQQQIRSDLSDALYSVAQGRAAWVQDGCGGRGSAAAPGAWLSVACGNGRRIIPALVALDALLPGRTFLAWARTSDLEEIMNVLESAIRRICPACGGVCSTQDESCDACRAERDMVAAEEERAARLSFTDEEIDAAVSYYEGRG